MCRYQRAVLLLASCAITACNWVDSTGTERIAPPVNNAPVAVTDSYSVALPETLQVVDADYDINCNSTTNSLLANDTRDNASPGPCLNAELIRAPDYAGNDFVADFSALGGFTYHPDSDKINQDKVLTDSFTYRVFDGEQYSAAAEVTFQLRGSNTQPTAQFDAYSVKADSINNNLNPAANDDSPFNTALEIIEIPLQPDRGGTVTILADSTLHYSPANQFSGVEFFTYTIENQFGQTSSAYVGIRVRGR